MSSDSEEDNHRLLGIANEPQTQIDKETLDSDTGSVSGGSVIKELGMDMSERLMTESEQLRLELLLKPDEIDQLQKAHNQRRAQAGLLDSSRHNEQGATANYSDQLRPSQELLTLAPDNPLLAGFQATLTQHLLRQNDKLKLEISELEGKLKCKGKETEEWGVEIVQKLHKKRQRFETTEDYRQILAEKIEKRSRTEKNAQEEKNKLKMLNEILDQNGTEEASLRIDSVAMKNFMQQLRDYEAQQTSELEVVQRVSQKTSIDINMFLHQKQKQDIIMFKIMEEILRLESLNKEMYQKAELKRSELQEIRLEIAEGVADTEVVQTQNKRMLQFWNRMLIEIQHKNKTVAQVEAALRAAERQFSGLYAQIDSYAKDSLKELKLSQDLTQKHKKINEVFSKLQRETIELIETCQKCDSELKGLSCRNHAVRKDLAQVLSGKKNKKGLLLTCQQRFQRLKDVKFQLEEEILKLLENKAVHNTSILNLQKKILSLSKKIRKQEIYSAKLENDVTKITLELEIEKGSLTLTKKASEEIRKDCETKEEEFHQLETKLKKTKDSLKISNLRCVEQTKTLEVLKEHNKQTSGCREEETLKSLKTEINEIQTKTDGLKQSWLRKQNEIVHFAQERTRQVHLYNTLKKQLLILEQKNWKLNYYLENNQNQKRRIERTIKFLLLRIETLNAESYKYHSQIQTFDAANHVTYKEYSGELKDAEEEMLGFTKDIDDLETKKEEISQGVVTLQQEFLIWEKKCEMMAVARRKLLEEQAAEGEIGTMKAEIHRMKVRFGQLLKAQEKLSQDMELCITRREGIMDVSLGREMRDTKTYMRHQLQRKVDDLRSRMKHLLAETKSLEKDCSKTETKKEELKKEWKAKQDQLIALKLTTSQMEDQLQEGQFHKQKNLELLVRKQRKGRLYAAIKTNKYQLLFANEASLQIELQRQVTMNLDLVAVLECLLVDFPPLTNPLTRILNVLRLSCL